MKRVGNLFETIISIENIINAAYLAQKGKRNRPDIINFNRTFIDNVNNIHHQLKTGDHNFGPYKNFTIYDNKPRIISAAPYKDRVIHHAVCNIIMPIFEKTFIDTSFANRKGKGTHKAVILCQKYLKKNFYFCKFDIKKYFPSIDHEILKKIIRKKIKCKKTLSLIEQIIDSSQNNEKNLYYYSGDTLFDPYERKRGLPIGNLTSQYFANIYLTPLDYFVREKLGIKYYIRYVDDFLLFHNDKKYLKYCKDKIEEHLENYRLKIHSNKSSVKKSCHGITFLGYRIFLFHIRLQRDSLIKARRRFKKYKKLFYKSYLTTEMFNSRVVSWIGHIKLCRSPGMIRKMFEY